MRFNTELLLSLLATVLLFGTSEAVPNGYSCGPEKIGTCQNYKGGCQPSFMKLSDSDSKVCDDGYCCIRYTNLLVMFLSIGIIARICSDTDTYASTGDGVSFVEWVEWEKLEV
ncbi:hypothetical protein BCR32DRAFT_294432 [Anaeromyces robustus]|uniref:Uncharacterized protein n=1 Tax=Anaeromyces robustus TaxID=1754192 RepID=A0A1Y1X0Z1_9FUNG|nr:hypothetical protein BCR32DRAFT_294432 [Anaeromyces robustus]|eukprot:ORX79469.1 hypothetical protein BCR32DRAFT_294432 [Anaeromyces robustus]